jgi:TolB protein
VSALVVALAPGPVLAVDPFAHGYLDDRAPVGGVGANLATSDTASDVVVQTHPGTIGKIVFTRLPFDTYLSGIWVMEADGTAETMLTPGKIGWGDRSPAWSPGGTMIAFSRDLTASIEDGAVDDIFTMQANGTGLKQLTRHPAADIDPSWSPDGSRIVFTSDRADSFEIYSMSIGGSDVRRLTTNSADDQDASYSPNGDRIAFTSDRAGNEDIYTMNADGSGVTRVTTHAAREYAPSWSPDGTKIAFFSNRSGTGDIDIYSMNADGSSVTNITNDPIRGDAHPSWSPDGSLIAFNAFPFGEAPDVYVMSATGGGVLALTGEPDEEYTPDWQPLPAFPLVDARFSMFEVDIHWVFDQAITTGCSAERYCPDDPVTREQMASFLVRALDLPAATQDWFTDDETSIHESNINRIAEAGIASGCGGTNYCPKAIVTREQMASFLARALDLPSSPTDFFTDDETSIHEPNINSIGDAGIATGCATDKYCPTAVVTRGQMAAFLHRALD